METGSDGIRGLAVAGASSATAIKLRWDAPYGGPPAAAYRILRDGAEIGRSATPSFTDAALAPNTTHTYRLELIDAAGEPLQRSRSLVARSEALPGAVLFDPDLARSGLSAFAKVVSPEAITIVDDPLLGAARKVMKMTVRDEQTGGITENPRSQVETRREYTAGQELWVGWSTMLPPGLPALPADGWLTLGEFYGPPWAGHSPFTIGLAPGLMANGWIAEPQPFVPGIWYDFVLHELLSTDASTGFVELFLNTGSGWEQQTIEGERRRYKATLDASNGGGPNYFKLANYRRRGMFSVATVFHAGPRIGTSFAAVAPDSYGERSQAVSGVPLATVR
jgi:hypothetical protein